MQVAFLLNEFPGISETFILNQITGLLDLGHDVDICIRQTDSVQKVHPDVKKYHLEQKVRPVPHIPRNKFLCRFKTLGLTILCLFKDPVKTYNALRILLRRPEGFSYQSYFLAALFILKKYDVIHCHYGPVGLRSMFLRDIGVKAKVGTVFHGYDLSMYLVQHGAEVYRELFEKGRLFLPISNYWKDKLLSLQCPPQNITVHHMGIDPNRFTFKERTIKPNLPIRLLTVGRLVEKKGHRFALEAIAEIIRREKNISYTIAGDGPLEKPLKTLAVELGIEHQVEFIGPVAQDTVIEKMLEAHIFLLPSITDSQGDQEGIPVVLMEALATGLPVITTIHSGIPELVQDGVSGYLTPEKDVWALIEKMNYLIEHPETWPQMGRAGRNFVEENYDINILNRKLVDIYQSAT